MPDFEIHPSALNRLTIVVGLFELIAVITLGFLVGPNVYQTYVMLPNDPTIIQVIFINIFILIFMCLIFITVVVYTIGKKIEIKDKLIFFKKKTLLGYGKWMIEKLIDISQVNTISDKKKVQVVWTGKALMPVTIYWLVFDMKDGTKQDLLLSGWDAGAIKNLFYFIKGKFPNVKFNNILMRDSSEKLSGIDEYLNKS